LDDVPAALQESQDRRKIAANLIGQFLHARRLGPSRIQPSDDRPGDRRGSRI
jgi:ABC-type branched-subunit amino acid transport system substrate-binding protein